MMHQLIYVLPVVYFKVVDAISRGFSRVQTTVHVTLPLSPSSRPSHWRVGVHSTGTQRRQSWHQVRTRSSCQARDVGQARTRPTLTDL